MSRACGSLGHLEYRQGLTVSPTGLLICRQPRWHNVLCGTVTEPIRGLHPQAEQSLGSRDSLAQHIRETRTAEGEPPAGTRAGTTAVATGDWSEAFPGELGARPPLRPPDAKTPHSPAHAGCVVRVVPVRLGVCPQAGRPCSHCRNMAPLPRT